MDILITDLLIDLFMIATTLSIILMALIQKFKNLKFIKKEWHIWVLNLFFSFAIGVPFVLYFYKLDYLSALWVSLFSFIGAPTIYSMMKKQNMINYKPKSLEETNQDEEKITISKDNEIKRN